MSEKADKLMEIMNVTNLIDVLSDRLLRSETGLSTAEKVLFKTVLGSCKPKFISEIGKVYEEHFTEPEIDQILAFYFSEVGQKMLEKIPVLQDAGQEVGERVFGEALRELTGEISS